MSIRLAIQKLQEAGGDFETADAPRGEIEHRVSGFISQVEGRPTGAALQDAALETKRINPKQSVTGRCIQGFATVYKELHAVNDSLEVFGKGCFARTLASDHLVRFLTGHDYSELVATTADHLQLADDVYGLAFSLNLPDTRTADVALQSIKSGERTAMSVGYNVVRDEVREIHGSKVRFVWDAELREISLVHKPAVKSAFAVLREAGESFDIKRSSDRLSLRMSGSTQRLLQLTDKLGSRR